ncbi:S49 family peptidase [Sphingobium yanoikuyae]|uniref:S49 family peptidase n=1 Tax=Sphingobium yanoikuyae TaxID=13690 RepID=UPI0024325D19|nr:S49 family peptidase [Sphingobium yanoikuyae]
MNQHILAAIRSQPWAIVPGYLDAIEALALRMIDHPALIEVERDGHQARFEAATARMGERAPGTRTAALRDGVGSLPVFGPIFPRASGLSTSGATTIDQMAADLRALEASPEVRTVLLTVDSPGGAVSGIHDFGQMIANFSKPIAVHITGQCCSAAYWFSSQASGGISMDPTGIVGSIGILMSTSFQENADASGRRAVDIVSSGAPNKRPDLSTEEGRDAVRPTLDALEAVFIAAVAKGRGVTEATVRADFGKGGTLTGKDAKAVGMVDRVEADGLDGAIRRLARSAPPAAPRRTAAANRNALARIRAGQ